MYLLEEVSRGILQHRYNRVDIRDQIVPVLGLLETAEGHLGARNVLLRVLEVDVLEKINALESMTKQLQFSTMICATYHGVLVPGDTLLLVGIGVGITLGLTGLAAKDAV